MRPYNVGEIEFIKEELDHLNEQAKSVDPETLNLGVLEKITYLLGSYSDSSSEIPEEECKNIIDKTELLKKNLQSKVKKAETKNLPESIIDDIYEQIGRLSEIIALLT